MCVRVCVCVCVCECERSRELSGAASMSACDLRSIRVEVNACVRTRFLSPPPPWAHSKKNSFLETFLKSFCCRFVTELHQVRQCYHNTG